MCLRNLSSEPWVMKIFICTPLCYVTSDEMFGVLLIGTDALRRSFVRKSPFLSKPQVWGENFHCDRHRVFKMLFRKFSRAYQTYQLVKLQISSMSSLPPSSRHTDKTFTPGKFSRVRLGLRLLALSLIFLTCLLRSESPIKIFYNSFRHFFVARRLRLLKNVCTTMK